jgi:NAD(P)-dependent dehydrogenase (short-subunit alcohol dehydrogenase family)
MSSDPVDKVAVVTGANSGIGRATAIHLAGRGFQVFGTTRSLDKVAKLQAMSAEAGVSVNLVIMDVADDLSVRDGFAEIFESAGHIDALVNNAGIAANGVTEEISVESMAEVMNVNLYGAVRCTQAVLRSMRERRSGCIVNVSSIIGRFAAIGQQPYVASKWALEGLSEAMAQELIPFGIRVAIIEPGVTKSAILAKNTSAPNVSGAYTAAYERLFSFYAVGAARATNPFEVAKVIETAIITDSPTLRYPVAWGADELLTGRGSLDDTDWVAMGALSSAEYYDAFEKAFGLRIHPH